MYVGPDNKGYKLLHGLYKNKTEKTLEVAISIDGVQGMVLIAEECVSIGEYVNPTVFFSPATNLEIFFACIFSEHLTLPFTAKKIWKTIKC